MNCSGKYLCWTVLIILLSTGLCIAQNPGAVVQSGHIRFQEIRSIKGDFILLDVDALDNVYAITKDFQLKKYNANGDSLSVWNDVKTYGNPTMLDVSNPLRILLYYKPFATVVILDRFLAFRHSINLRRVGIFNVNAIANSYDNNIWVFDEQDMRLKKISDDGQLLFATSDWRMLFETAPSPYKIIDHENSVYVFDESSGWYIFDYYGSLKKKLPAPSWKLTGKNRDFMYGFSRQTMHTAELPRLNGKDYALPQGVSGEKEIRIMNGKAYLLGSNGIKVYNIETNQKKAGL